MIQLWLRPCIRWLPSDLYCLAIFAVVIQPEQFSHLQLLELHGIIACIVCFTVSLPTGSGSPLRLGKQRARKTGASYKRTRGKGTGGEKNCLTSPDPHPPRLFWLAPVPRARCFHSKRRACGQATSRSDTFAVCLSQLLKLSTDRLEVVVLPGLPTNADVSIIPANSSDTVGTEKVCSPEQSALGWPYVYVAGGEGRGA